MHSVAHQRRSAAAARPPRGFWERLFNRWRRWRDAARRHAELCALDAAALRDLGLRREELGSIEAESLGAVACTRRRLVGCCVDAARGG